MLPFPQLLAIWNLVQSKDHDLFTGHGAAIVVQAQYLGTLIRLASTPPINSPRSHRLHPTNNAASESRREFGTCPPANADIDSKSSATAP